MFNLTLITFAISLSTPPNFIKLLRLSLDRTTSSIILTRRKEKRKKKGEEKHRKSSVENRATSPPQVASHLEERRSSRRSSNRYCRKPDFRARMGTANVCGWASCVEKGVASPLPLSHERSNEGWPRYRLEQRGPARWPAESGNPLNRIYWSVSRVLRCPVSPPPASVCPLGWHWNGGPFFFFLFSFSFFSSSSFSYSLPPVCTRAPQHICASFGSGWPPMRTGQRPNSQKN